jgi:hypothetical protein
MTEAVSYMDLRFRGSASARATFAEAVDSKHRYQAARHWMMEDPSQEVLTLRFTGAIGQLQPSAAVAKRHGVELIDSGEPAGLTLIFEP